MKITKAERKYQTVYYIDGKTAMHVYAPKQSCNKGEDYLCYLHDTVVPAIAKATLKVTITDNPNKETRGDKEKFGKMFRVAKVKDAFDTLNAIAKMLPKSEVKTVTKAPATKKSAPKKKNELVFKQIKKEETPA